MQKHDILQQRIRNQHLAEGSPSSPEALLTHLVCTQAQDYGQAKWALGSRLPGLTDTAVETAIAEHRIVRTWLCRSTIHLAATTDVRWLLDLLAPRYIKSSSARYVELELDDQVFRQSRAAVERLFRDQDEVTREQLTDALAEVGVLEATGPRLSHIILRLALEQLLCFGTRRGADFTYTLLDRVAPRQSTTLAREEALGELARRYFSSRGPALIDDFATWSGLSIGEARKGLEAVQTELEQAVVDGKTYWYKTLAQPAATVRNVFLLAGFDEYILGYKERGPVLGGLRADQVASSNGIFYPVAVIDGRVAGTWKRTVKKDRVLLEIKPFRKFNDRENEGLAQAAADFGLYLEKTAVLQLG